MYSNVFGILHRVFYLLNNYVETSNIIVYRRVIPGMIISLFPTNKLVLQHNNNIIIISSP